MYHAQEEVHLLVIGFLFYGLSSFVEDTDVFVVNLLFPDMICIDCCAYDDKCIYQIGENTSIPWRRDDYMNAGYMLRLYAVVVFSFYSECIFSRLKVTIDSLVVLAPYVRSVY